MQSPSQTYDELVAHARRLGVEVRVEPFGVKIIERRGGMCRVKGERVIVMDAAMPVVERVGVIAAALRDLGVVPIAWAGRHKKRKAQLEAGPSVCKPHVQPGRGASTR